MGKGRAEPHWDSYFKIGNPSQLWSVDVEGVGIFDTTREFGVPISAMIKPDPNLDGRQK